MEFLLELRPILLLLIAIAVPLILLRLKQERLLLGWVAVTMFVQIFDTSILTNLPAGRIVGLMYLPTVLLQGRQWLAQQPVKLWLVNLAYLVMLGVFFGWIWPWEDITNARPFSLAAHGRWVVYTLRMISDASLAIFIAGQLQKAGSLYYLGRAMVIGSTMTGLVGVAYLVVNTDFYYPITGLGEVAFYIDRARGLSYEPRGLGLACAYGVMILLLGRRALFKSWLLILVVNLIGLLATYSASSYVLLGVGVLTATIFFTNRERLVVAATILLAATITAGAYMAIPDRFEYAITTLQARFDPDYKLSGMPPGTWGEEIAYRLDVFDASALLFMLYEPEFALIGTGPGLISLPASYYVPPGEYSEIWTAEIGVNSPPFHGLLLEVSNSGALGLALWIAQVWICWRSLRRLSRNSAPEEERPEWRFGAALFLTGVVFYIVQVSTSPVWSIILAVGWVGYRAATQAAREPDWANEALRRRDSLWRPGLEPRTE
jgi:hypothetical protein